MNRSISATATIILLGCASVDGGGTVDAGGPTDTTGGTSASFAFTGGAPGIEAGGTTNISTGGGPIGDPMGGNAAMGGGASLSGGGSAIGSTANGGSMGGGPMSVCTPGVTQVCLGAGRCEGAQACASDGLAWGPCDCGAGTGGASATGGRSNLDTHPFGAMLPRAARLPLVGRLPRAGHSRALLSRALPCARVPLLHDGCLRRRLNLQFEQDLCCSAEYVHDRSGQLPLLRIG